MFANQLYADGQPAVLRRGYGDAGQPCQVGGDGVDVCQVYLQRAHVFVVEQGGCRGCHRAEDEVYLLEGLREVLCYQGAYLLRFCVVGIVEAAGEYIGA